MTSGRGPQQVRNVVFTVAALVASAAVVVPAQKDADGATEAARLQESITVLNEAMKAADTSIPSAILGKAEAIAVFPSTIKAGLVVGGIRGRGVLSGRTAKGWTAPTFLTLTGGTFGLQIGGQSADIVLVIQNRRGVENFLKNQFKFGADASAAAGPVGRDAQAATDLQMRAEILSYSRARGLFAGVTVNGSTVRTDVDANYRFYNTRFSGAQVVLSELAGTPVGVKDWIDTLAKYAPPR